MKKTDSTAAGPSRDPLSPLTFLMRAVRVFPQKDAVLYGDQRLSWESFAILVGRYASALKRDGVQHGDRVAVLLPNVPVQLASCYAVPLAGGVLVAINTRLGAAEISYILRHSEPRVLLVDPELSSKLAGVDLPSELRIVTVLDATEGEVARDGAWPSFDEWTDGLEPLPIENSVVDEEDLIAINYTSGTTGMPKGVMYTHRGVTLNAMGNVGSLGLTSTSVYLWTLPMFHCNGWCMTWTVTAAAAAHVCLRAPRPVEIVRLVREKRVTHFSAAPTLLRMIAGDSAAQGVQFEPEVSVCTGGAPPSPQDLLTMERLGIRITHLYGLTETYGPHVICEMQADWNELPLHDRALLVARQGVPLLHATYLRVVDPATMVDTPADGETVGEVVMRGNNVMSGYYRDEEATAHAFEGGWFHSGDLAVMHPDGYIELRDRSKDVIISGGENVSSIEVENVIYEHPAVHEVAVVASPDDRWGEIPKAFITLKPGSVATPEEIIQFTRERLSHFKCPKLVEFGELPKTGTGKIQKFLLREREWAGYDKRIR